MATNTPSGKNEFRQRSGGNVAHYHQRSVSSSSLQQNQQTPPPPSGGISRRSSMGSLPRPGASTFGGSARSPPMLHRHQSVPNVVTPQQQRFSPHSSFRSLGDSTKSASSLSSSSGYGGGGYAGGGVGYTSPSYKSGSSAANYNNGYNYNNNSRPMDSDTDKYAKKKQQQKEGVGLGRIFCFLVIFIYSILISTVYHKNRSSVNSVLSKLNQPDADSVIDKVERLEQQLKANLSAKKRREKLAVDSTNMKIYRLEAEIKSLNFDVDQLNGHVTKNVESKFDRYTTREKAYSDQIGWLMDMTRRESKRAILEKFGPGPHKVEVTFEIEKEVHEEGDNDTHDQYKFIIELAPIDTVPHALHLFLEQVDHDLLKGTHFYLNGPHIIQAGPQPNWNDYHEDMDHAFTSDHSKKVNEEVGDSAVETMDKYEYKLMQFKEEQEVLDESEYEEDSRIKAFADLGLDGLTYPDYNETYPHVSWTVGYAGRPGGTDWYINKVDNTLSHGPGGKSHHVLDEQGDSCFGTISAEGNGRNWLSNVIYRADTYSDNTEWHHFIQYPIEIVNAVILTKKWNDNKDSIKKRWNDNSDMKLNHLYQHTNEGSDRHGGVSGDETWTLNDVFGRTREVRQEDDANRKPLSDIFKKLADRRELHNGRQVPKINHATEA